MAESLAALQTARSSKTSPPFFEVEPPSSSSDDEEDSSLIKESLEDIKSTWKKVTEKRIPITKPAKKQMSLRLASLLVYTVGVKCHGFNAGVAYAPEHVFSLSENAANKLVDANMNELIRHTDSHLVRVYPKGTRVTSSNYQPHRYWAGGCQVVALNWQTVGKSDVQRCLRITYFSQISVMP